MARACSLGRRCPELAARQTQPRSPDLTVFQVVVFRDRIDRVPLDLGKSSTTVNPKDDIFCHCS